MEQHSENKVQSKASEERQVQHVLARYVRAEIGERRVGKECW